MKYVIWDRVVRLFHWSVAALFLLNFWFFEAGEALHENVGYAVAALLAVRSVWGFCGSAHARFANFLPTRARLKHYFQHPETRHPMAAGHNPLGALMVFLMLFLLALVAFSGWLQETDRYWGELWPQLVHEWSANVLMAADVSAVIIIQQRSGVPLVKPMITGERFEKLKRDELC